MKRRTLYWLVSGMVLATAVAAWVQVTNLRQPTPPVASAAQAPQSARTRTLTVAGRSMAPTIQPGERVEVDESTRFTPARGDLVVLRFATSRRPLLKRVIAVSGDRVEFIGGRLRLGDNWLDTSWWPKDRRLRAKNYRLLELQLSRYGHIIPDRTLMVMGDNAANSFDSGDFGLVARDQIIGRVITRR